MSVALVFYVLIYLKDSNQTPLGALSDYMAENWDKIKNLSRYDILEKFYDQLN